MRRALGVVAVVVLVALASCQADAPVVAGPSGGVAAASSAAAASSPASSPAPVASGPCASGSCQVEVHVGDVVALPERYGLGPLEVTAITADSVEMVAPLTGPGFSISGCSGGGGVTSQGRGGVRLACRVGTVAAVNNAMSLEVVEIRSTVAVVRIKPAG